MERTLYTTDQIIDRFKYVIANNVTHRLKSHCEDISSFWKSMVTGLHQECFVVSYRLSQSDAQRKQRVRLHIPESASIINQIDTTLREIIRSDDHIDCFTGAPEIIADVQSCMKCFKGEETLEEFLNEQVIELNKWDPNAFMLVDHYEFDATIEKAHPYPTVIYSCAPQAIEKEKMMKDGSYKTTVSFKQKHAHWRDWEEYNNTLQYLIFDDTESVVTVTEGQEKPVETKIHYCYAKGISAKLTLVPYGYDHSAHIENSGADEIEYISLTGNGTLNYKFPQNKDIPVAAGTSDLKYILEVWNTMTNKVPFRRVGFHKDACTNGEVYESILHGAKYKFLDLINKKAELDEAIATKGFIKSYQYVPSCTHQDPDNPADCCVNGKMFVSNKKCPACIKHPGKKKIIHSSSSDIITFDMVYDEPGDPKEMIDLAKLIHNEPIPKESILLTKDLVEACKVDISKAIFNTNIFIRGTLASTSPDAIKAMMDPVNNVLNALDECKARLMRFAILCIADYREHFGKIDFTRKVPSDYHLESTSELAIERKNLIESGAPAAIINAVDAKIMRKMVKDNPEHLNKVKIKEAFRPFSGLSQAERISKQAMLPEYDDKRILCIYYDEIFRKIDTDKKYINFYKADIDRDAVLSEVIEEFRLRYEQGNARDTETPVGPPTIVDLDDE